MKHLTWWGTLLFLLGLLTGLMLAMAPGIAANPRGMLAAHLEGVLNGIFLIVVGLMADRVRLSLRVSGIWVGLLLFGTFGNWITTTIAGVSGASQAMPIAGAGHHAAPAVEQFILITLVSAAFAMIGAVGMLLFGLRSER
jgi:hydroxylaminobenzene mutase